MSYNTIMFPNSLVEEPQEYPSTPHRPALQMRRRASTQSKHTSVDTFDKLRQDRSARKLDSFFGEHLPLDVCISEIRKEGLKAMLESRVPLCYFLLHLINEYSCENLFFFLEIERYDKMKNMPKKQWSTAHHIFAVYMTHNSPFEINVNDEVRSKVVAMIRDHKADHCFDPAKKAVYVILESSFIRFRESPIWNKMISCCGEWTTYYDKHTREKVINELIAFLEQQHNSLFNHPLIDAPVLASVRQSSKNRLKRVKAMISVFSQTELNIDTKVIHSNTPRPKSWSVLGIDFSVLKKGACY